MGLLLLAWWGVLLTGLLWLRAARPRDLGERNVPPPIPRPATPPDLARESVPPTWELALLAPLCLWLVAGGTAPLRQSWASLATIGALSLILLAMALYLSTGENDLDD